MSLSLPAELLLLSFDPATRRPYRVRRGRLDVALAAAEAGGTGGSRMALRLRGRGARRRALAELQAAGLAEPGRKPVLADRAALARRYERLAAGMRSSTFEDERDRTLVLLLASTGALAQRLRGRDPHWYKRMVTGLIPEENPVGTSFARDSRGRLREERAGLWDESELGVVPGLRDLGFADAFRALNGYAERSPSWTFRRISGHGGGWRLDHVFCSAELDPAACAYHHGWRDAGLSDHSALEADLEPRA